MEPNVQPPRPGSYLGLLRQYSFSAFLVTAVIASMAGNLFSTAIFWSVSSETESNFLTSVIMALRYAPILLFGLLGGVAADRWDRKKIMLTADVLYALIACLVFIDYLLARTVNWPAFLAVFTIGSVVQFDSSASAAAIPLVMNAGFKGSQLVLAKSLLGASSVIAGVIGYSLGGLLIAYFGLFGTLAAYVLLYSVSAVVTWTITLHPKPSRADASKSVRRDLASGIHLVFSNKLIRTLIILSVLFNLVTVPVLALTPFYAAQVSQNGASTYGLLMGAEALGEAIGAYAVVRIDSKLGTKNTLFLSVMATAVAVLALSTVSNEALGLLDFSIIGFAGALEGVLLDTLLLARTDSQFTGRVMGAHIFLAGAVIPPALLMGGLLGGWIGLGVSFLILGSLTFVVGLGVFLGRSIGSSRLVED